MHFQRYYTNMVVNLTKYGYSEFYNRSMKTWLQGNDIKIYSTHKEGKPVVAERLIKTLYNKMCKL